jgi:hypothetical protein
MHGLPPYRCREHGATLCQRQCTGKNEEPRVHIADALHHARAVRCIFDNTAGNGAIAYALETIDAVQRSL